MLRGMKNWRREIKSQIGIMLAGQNRKNAYSISRALIEIESETSSLVRQYWKGSVRDLPDYADDAPSNSGCPFNVEQFMKSLLFFLLAKAGQCEVKYAVQHDHNQDQHVAVISSLVDSDDEAETFHEERNDKEAGHESHHL